MKVVLTSSDDSVVSAVRSLLQTVIGPHSEFSLSFSPSDPLPLTLPDLILSKQRLADLLFRLQDDSATYFIGVDIAASREFDGAYGFITAIVADSTRNRFGFGTSATFPLIDSALGSRAAFFGAAHLDPEVLVARAVTAALIPFNFFETPIPDGVPPEVIRYVEGLTVLERNAFAAQLALLDFGPQKVVDTSAVTAALEAVPDPPDYGEEQGDVVENGVQAIRAGSVAVLIMAGGQGSRLRAPVPKALMELEIPSKMTLLQIQLKRVARLQELYDVRQIPVYILTSDATHSAIAAYLIAHANFGLAPPMLVKQRQLPARLPDGRFVLADKNKVLAAPNGNGALFQELRDSGALADMRARGVKYVDIHPIDNALARPADPAFVGAMIYEGADAAVKVLAKRPKERMGTLCKRNGKTVVIEYSEIPDGEEAAYRWGNTGLQFYSVNLIERAAQVELPYHVAVKRELIVRENGEREIGEVRKFERFVFDALEFCEEVAIVACQREDEFAPIKNTSGAPEDSPETARDLLLAMHARWAKAAGIIVEGDGPIEITPETSYAGEGLERFAGRTFPAGTIL
jgi:UDP-N-acetylglucosamine/UDP-N-acetylgalactosamine diphosphorylase